eukprot:gene15656-17234_t
MNDTNTSLTCFGLQYVDFRITKSVKSSAIISAYISVTTSIMTTIFSSLILYILAKNSELQKPTNLLIGMLCLSDLLNGLIAQPMHTIKRIQDLRNIHMCNFKIWAAILAYFFTGISGMHMIIISIHRFVCISYLTIPNVVHENSFMKFKVALSFVWISWALLVGLSSVKIVSRFTLNIICTSIVMSSLVVVICSYIRVRRVYKVRPEMNSALSQQIQERRRQRNLYQLKTNLFILLSFIISYVPRVACFAYEKLDEDASFSARYVCGRLANAVTHINAALHPIIYCWRVAAFRSKIILLLTGILAKFQ